MGRGGAGFHAPYRFRNLARFSRVISLSYLTSKYLCLRQARLSLPRISLCRPPPPPHSKHIPCLLASLLTYFCLTLKPMQDEAAMDKEMDQALARIAEERQEVEEELEALSNELKAAYASAAMGKKPAACSSGENSPSGINSSSRRSSSSGGASGAFDGAEGMSDDVLMGVGGGGGMEAGNVVR